jgi:hypothetical protein
MPFSGSFKALPSWIAPADTSVCMAVAISTIACCAFGNVSLMFVKVSSRLSPFWISSSSNRDFPAAADMEPAISRICSAVIPAAPPVDLIAASVCAKMPFASRASLMDEPMKSLTWLVILPMTLAARKPPAVWSRPLKNPWPDSLALPVASFRVLSSALMLLTIEATPSWPLN